MFERLPERDPDVVDVGQQCVRVRIGQVCRVSACGASARCRRRSRSSWRRRPGNVSRVRLHSHLRRPGSTRSAGAAPAVLQPPSSAPVRLVAGRPGHGQWASSSAWRRRRRWTVRAARGDGRVPRGLPARRPDRGDRLQRRRRPTVGGRAPSAAAASPHRLLPRPGPRLHGQRQRRRLSGVQLAQRNRLMAGQVVSISVSAGNFPKLAVE